MWEREEPFIQHCFYSNVFKGESKEKIVWDSVEGDGEAMRITCTRFFFFFSFLHFLQQQMFSMGKYTQQKQVTACILLMWAFTATVLWSGRSTTTVQLWPFFLSQSSVEFLTSEIINLKKKSKANNKTHLFFTFGPECI